MENFKELDKRFARIRKKLEQVEDIKKQIDQLDQIGKDIMQDKLKTVKVGFGVKKIIEELSYLEKESSLYDTDFSPWMHFRDATPKKNDTDFIMFGNTATETLIIIDTMIKQKKLRIKSIMDELERIGSINKK